MARFYNTVVNSRVKTVFKNIHSRPMIERCARAKYIGRSHGADTKIRLFLSSSGVYSITNRDVRFSSNCEAGHALDSFRGEKV